MQAVDRPASELSSSSISSPPASPQDNGLLSNNLHLAPPTNLAKNGSTPGAEASAQTTTITNSSNGNGTTPSIVDKPKRVRKKKELGPDGEALSDGKPKEKKPRKPREPKEKTASNGTAPATAPRKKIKLEEKPSDVTNVARQSTITELVNNYAPSSASPPAATALPPQNTATTSVPPSNAARPATSGQRYDPVRGIAVDSPYSRPSQPATPSASFATPATSQVQAQVNRASASPSIASLIDHPTTFTPTSQIPQVVANQTLATTPQQPSNGFISHLSPTPSPAKPVASADIPMDIDTKQTVAKTSATDRSSDAKAPSKASSAAPTPKPAPAAAPKGTGSGLLSSSDLFGGPASSDGLLQKGVNIDIRISLDPKGGNHVNVASEIIKKYGRDALYPRAAAHRERLLQVMVAANKLDGGSADDMSIDLMSENEGDSNVEMGGMEDEPSGAADGDKPRKRRKKVEEYDVEDEFIDDTELAWQQQAAVAKDGFFVYSGPLITEGDALRAEAAATGSRGGRGRGRGRGRGGSSTTHASLAEKKDVAATPTAGTPPGRGGRSGRGRGTGATRKPRITKADKEKMEAEKSGREKAAANIAAPSAAPATAPATATAAIPASASSSPLTPANHISQIVTSQPSLGTSTPAMTAT